VTGGDAVTPGQWLDAFLALPARAATMAADITEIARRTERIEMVGDQTQAAITDLVSAVDEVASELDALDARLVEGATIDADTAAALAPITARLRGLRPDPEPPTP